MILLIDNYDSFVYNLYQYACEYDHVLVKRNDKISLNEINKLNPDHIIISPGPKRPEDSGISINLIQKYYKSIPILGICLGHQCIASAFGSEIIKSEIPVHGKTSNIIISNSKIYKNIKSPILATRYHSLIIKETTLSNDFVVIARTEDHIIMGIEHKMYPLVGLQYHPESILSDYGKIQVKNFITEYKKKN
jgi:anthranilate synthase/aminodeoxychorismate synthase-like glutamine amidotransferase